jgi:hypothetical protein
MQYLISQEKKKILQILPIFFILNKKMQYDIICKGKITPVYAQ